MGIVEIGGIGGAVAMQDELGLKGMRDFEKRKKTALAHYAEKY